jgi:hypothetical protein
MERAPVVVGDVVIEIEVHFNLPRNRGIAVQFDPQSCQNVPDAGRVD